jgi:hypothetical protein
MIQKPAIAYSGAALRERNIKIDRREDQRCARCGRVIWENGSRHHRKFKSRGGGDEVSNGVLLCGSGTTGCHGWAHANPDEAREAGFAVNSWENPKDVPVRLFLAGGAPVYLDDDGQWWLEPPREPEDGAA